MSGELSSTSRPPLYVIGIPGKVGGASTKIVHLIYLLRDVFNISIVAPEVAVSKSKEVRQLAESQGVPLKQMRDLPRQLSGVSIGICDGDFFVSGRARALKERGLKVVWSNEMM